MVILLQNVIICLIKILSRCKTNTLKFIWYSFQIFDKCMEKLVKYTNLSTLCIKWPFLGVGLDNSQDLSPSPNLVKFCYSNLTY